MNKKLIVVLGVFSGSVSGVLGRFADSPSTVLVFYRLAFSVLIAVPLTLLKNKEELSSVRGKPLILSIISGVFFGLHLVTYFESIKFTSISSSTTLVSAEVFFVAFALVFLFKEKVSAKSWIGIVITFLGTCLIAAGDFADGSDVVKGDLLALLACFLMSVYTLIGRAVRKSGISTTTYTCIVYTAAAVTVSILSVLTGEPLCPVGGRTLLCALGLTVFCTFLCHSIYSWSLKFVQASYVSNAKMLSPVFATIWGLLFFKEVPGILGILGGITVIAGVLIYSNNLAAEENAESGIRNTSNAESGMRNSE